MRGKALLLLFSFLIFVACEVKPTPEPINYGKDACAFCKMVIVDAGFAAELKTKTGKVYKFDAIECLAAFILAGIVPEEKILMAWVSDFANKGELIPVQKAKFLVSPKLRSPMGLNIAAFGKEEDLKEALRVFKGKVMTWEEVLEYVREKWKDKIQRAHSG